MARLWSCGFELGSNTTGVEWYTCNGAGASVQSATVRSGAYAGKILNPASGVRTGWAHQMFAAGAGASCYSRIYFSVHTLPNVSTTIAVLHNGNALASDSTLECGVRLNTDGTLTFTYGGTPIGSNSSALSLDRWYRVEFFEDISSVAGAGVNRARLDGVEWAATTTGSNAGTFTSLRVGANMSAETCTVGEWYFDDIAYNDSTGTTQNSWPGAGSIVHLHPNAAGDFAEGAATGAATGWQAVDEVVPDDATSYWSLVTDASANSTSPDRLDVNLEAFAPSADSVTLVQVGARLAATTAVSCSWVPRIKSQASGTVVEGTTTATGATAWNTHGGPLIVRVYKLTSYTDPQAGGAWTASLLGTTQIGARAPDGNPDMKISTLWALVEYVPSAESSFGFVATSAATMAASLTASAPAPASATIAPTLAAVALASSFTASAPTAPALTFAATTTTVPAASFSAAAVGASAVTFASTLDAIGLASSLAASAPMTTGLRDTFSGTPGNTLTGTTPDLVANGSDTWQPLEVAGFGTFVFVSGGGATSSGAGNWYQGYALTGVDADQTITVDFRFAAVGSTSADFYVRRNSASGGFVVVRAMSQFNLLRIDDSATTAIDSEPVTWAAGPTYRLVIALTGTAATVSLDGIPTLAATVQTPDGSQLLLSQSGGAAGNVAITAVRVETAAIAALACNVTAPTTLAATLTSGAIGASSASVAMTTTTTLAASLTAAVPGASALTFTATTTATLATSLTAATPGTSALTFATTTTTVLASSLTASAPGASAVAFATTTTTVLTASLTATGAGVVGIALAVTTTPVLAGSFATTAPPSRSFSHASSVAVTFVASLTATGPGASTATIAPAVAMALAASFAAATPPARSFGYSGAMSVTFSAGLSVSAPTASTVTISPSVAMALAGSFAAGVSGASGLAFAATLAPTIAAMTIVTVQGEHIGITVFTSRGSRRGVDPGRSSGSRRGVDPGRSSGVRRGVDPERSTGAGR